MEVDICPECGKEHERDSIFCSQCGIELNKTKNIVESDSEESTVAYEMEERFCYECGKEYNRDSKFCDQCGTKINKTEKLIDIASEGSVEKNVSIEVERPKKKGKVWAIISIIFGMFSFFLTVTLNDVYEILALIILGLLVFCIFIGLTTGFLGRKYRVLSTVGLGLNVLFLVGLIIRFSNISHGSELQEFVQLIMNKDREKESLIATTEEKNHSDTTNDLDKQLLHAIEFSNRETVVEEVKSLLKAGANPNSKEDLYGHNALMLAIIYGPEDLIKCLLYNVDVNEQVAISGEDEDPVNGQTALMVAASSGNYEATKLLIKAGARLNMQDEHGYTALMLAIPGEYGKIVKLLLDNKADSTLRTQEGYTALDIAIQREAESIIKLLGGQFESNKSFDEQLFEAVKNGDIENTKSLLEKGANPNFTAKDFNESVLTAAIRGSRELDIVELLLDSGANPNIQDSFGNTAIYHAICLGCSNKVELVEAILKSKPDLNIKDNSGKTLLDFIIELYHMRMIASEQEGTEYLKLMKLLLDSGADPNINDILSKAKAAGWTEAVDLLRRSGAIE